METWHVYTADNSDSQRLTTPPLPQSVPHNMLLMLLYHFPHLLPPPPPPPHTQLVNWNRVILYKTLIVSLVSYHYDNLTTSLKPTHSEIDPNGVVFRCSVNVYCVYANKFLHDAVPRERIIVSLVCSQLFCFKYWWLNYSKTSNRGTLPDRDSV